jgi:hypothetical protein
LRRDGIAHPHPSSLALWFEPPTGKRGTGAECDKFADR